MIPLIDCHSSGIISENFVYVHRVSGLTITENTITDLCRIYVPAIQYQHIFHRHRKIYDPPVI